MRARSKWACGLAGVAIASALSWACTVEEEAAPVPAPPANDAGENDAGNGPATDGTAEDDAGALFPAGCEKGSFCPVAGLFGAAIDARTRLNAVVGTSERDVWVVGSLGAALHYDGASWKPSSFAAKETMTRLLLRPDGSIWATAALASVHVLAPGAAEWRTVAPADASGTVYIDSSGITSMWTTPGSEWVWVSIEGVYLGSVRIMRMRPEGDGILVEETKGSVPYAFKQRVLSLGSIGSDELWGVGDMGSAFRFTKVTTEPVLEAFNTQTQATLQAMRFVAPNDAVAIGAAGTIRRYRGTGRTWDVVHDVPANATLRSLWSTSASDVWAVGDDATIVHFDGTTWSRIPVGGLGDRRPALYGVWSTDASHVWAVGESVLLTLSTEGAPR